MRRATAPVAMSGTAEDEDEGEEEEGGPAAGRRAPGRQEIHLEPAAEERTGSSCSAAARDTSRRPQRRGRTERHHGESGFSIICIA